MRLLLLGARRHAIALVVLLVLWIATLAVGGPFLYGALMFVAGIVGALVGPDHPVRNGAIAGVLVILAGVVIAAVAAILGMLEYPEGESALSYWLEVPFWLLVLGGPGVLVSLAGGMIARLIGPAAHHPHPR